MKIQYTEDLPTGEEYKGVFDTTGWNHEYQASADELHRALKQSWYMLCAYHSGRLVGFGRVLSDGVLYAMIYDLIVIPSYQGKGIGSKILRRMIDRCQQARIREVQLFSAAGKFEFYQKRGFVVRPNVAPGMQLKK